MKRSPLPSAVRSLFSPAAFASAFAAVALAGVAVTGCSDSNGGGCAPGTLNCSCDASSQCVTGLVCDGANLCVQGAGTGGVSGTGGTVGVGGAATGGTLATGGATGGTAGSGGSTGGTAGSGGATGGTAGSGGAATGGALGTGGAAGGTAGTGGAAGGTAGTGGAGGGTAGTGGGSSGGEFTLTSAELVEGAEFAEANTCAGGGSAGQGSNFGEAISLSWAGAPAGTQSFALVMLDVTLTESGGQFAQFGYHSAFWDLPASVMSLPAGSWVTALADAGAKDITTGYLGPCPVGLQGAPPPPHTYVFTLYALPDATIALESSLNAQFVQTLEDAALGSVTLSGVSSASM